MCVNQIFYQVFLGIIHVPFTFEKILFCMFCLTYECFSDIIKNDENSVYVSSFW